MPGPLPLPGPYARLVRRLDGNRFRRHPGETLEETLAAAVRTRPDLSGDAARFLGLYHRDRFGPAPLPPEAREEAFRLANRLRRKITDAAAHNTCASPQGASPVASGRSSPATPSERV